MLKNSFHTIRLALLALLLASASYTFAQDDTSNDPAKQIDAVVENLRANYQFNGGVLVIKDGKVIFSQDIGVADFRNSTPLKAGSAYNLADVSQQFTAAAMAQLKEQGKLSYDDPITKYLPEIPYADIKIHDLLTHTSGLPDYQTVFAIHWDKTKTATNKDLIQLFKQVKPELTAKPGLRVQYNHTDYALLASIVERVSGQSFAAYLTDKIFTPLGMTQSAVLGYPEQAIANRAYGFKSSFITAPALSETDYLQGILGSENVYSSLNDLVKWQAAITTDKLLKQSSLAEAFLPTHLNDGSTTPTGFGWALSTSNTTREAELSGAKGGWNVVYGRLLDQNTAIVVISNTGSTYVYDLKDAIYNILQGKPYALPKPSAARIIAATLANQGAGAINGKYNELRATPGQYLFLESEINSLGYELLELKRYKDAIAVFKLNVDTYPKSYNVYDSIAEAYLLDGNKDQAVLNYRRSLAIFPANDNAQDALKRILGTK